MHSLTLAALLVSVAATSSIATLAARKQVQRSTVYPWSSAGTTPNDWGAVRQVMRTPTPTLDELEIHISTLNPGKSPHAPHQGIIFQASNELHNVTNIGQTPATYFVIGWDVPGAKP